MVVLVLLMVHIVLCLVASSDLAALVMSTRARGFWFAVVVLLPVIGVAVYALFGRQRWGGGSEGWFDQRGKSGQKFGAGNGKGGGRGSGHPGGRLVF